jgi:hypothetical protein
MAARNPILKEAGAQVKSEVIATHEGIAPK